MMVVVQLVGFTRLLETEPIWWQAGQSALKPSELKSSLFGYRYCSTSRRDLSPPPNPRKHEILKARLPIQVRGGSQETPGSAVVIALFCLSPRERSMSLRQGRGRGKGSEGRGRGRVRTYRLRQGKGSGEGVGSGRIDLDIGSAPGTA
jgi:hypothetical protein